MEFFKTFTYISWSIVLLWQLITDTAALNASYADDSSFQAAVIEEIEAIKSQMQENKELGKDSVKQISALKSEVEALKLENAKLKQEIDGCKSGTANNFVSFTAVATVDVYYVPDDVVQFDNALRNYGDAYNSQNGVFTCPVSGYYLWFVNLFTSDNGDISAEIYVDNQELPMPELVSTSHGYDNGATLGVSHCAAGSEVFVRVTELDGWTHESTRFRLNSFTGVLLAMG